jgi:hypothetical protein
MKQGVDPIRDRPARIQPGVVVPAEGVLKILTPVKEPGLTSAVIPTATAAIVLRCLE